jgi:hypothetical protein
MKLREATPVLLKRYKTGTVDVQLTWPNGILRTFSVPTEGHAMQLISAARSDNYTWRRLREYRHTLELRDIVATL